MNTLIKQSDQGGYRVTEIDVIDEERIAELENAKLIYSPEFVPFYFKEVKKYAFNEIEGLIYGFIRFYLSNAPSGKFYFTNEQLGLLFDKSVTTISNSVQKILSCGEFKATYKIKTNGGKFRLLENCKSDYQNSVSETYRKLQGNKNSIKENSISISKDMEQSSYGNPDVSRYIKGINKYLPLKLPEDVNARRAGKNALDLLTKLSKNGEVKEGREFMSEDKWENARRFLSEYDAVKLSKGYYPQSWQKINENIKIWISNKGSLEAK